MKPSFYASCLFPKQLLNKKQKNGPCVEGRGIVLPFSKTQPVFCFLCAVGMRRLPSGKKEAFVSFGIQKKEIFYRMGLAAAFSGLYIP